MKRRRRPRRYTPEEAVQFLETWLRRPSGDGFLRTQPEHARKLLYALSDLDAERVPLIRDDSQGIASCECSPDKIAFDVRVWLDQRFYLSVCRGCDAWGVFARKPPTTRRKR